MSGDYSPARVAEIISLAVEKSTHTQQAAVIDAGTLIRARDLLLEYGKSTPSPSAAKSNPYPSVRASVVLKWPVAINDEEQTIGGGDVVLVALQNDTLCVWTREYEGDLGGNRMVRVVGTGHLLSGLGTHVGSAVAPPFVWHVFEVAP